MGDKVMYQQMRNLKFIWLVAGEGKLTLGQYLFTGQESEAYNASSQLAGWKSEADRY